jgi:putative transposase
VLTVKLPAQSPDLNAYAERFVRSIREECLSRVIPMGERHLRWVIGEYVNHYHLERNHQGLGNELIEPPGGTGRGRVACRQRLGGLLKFYYRKAA